MHVRAWTRKAVALVAAVAATTGLGVVGAGAANAADRQTFAGSVPGWATARAERQRMTRERIVMHEGENVRR